MGLLLFLAEAHTALYGLVFPLLWTVVCPPTPHFSALLCFPPESVC